MQLDRSCTLQDMKIIFIQELAIETFNVKHGIASKFFESIFVINNNTTQLRSVFDVCLPKISTEYFGRKSRKYSGPVVWSSLPSEMKRITALSDLKESIKKWKPNCPCRI